MGGCFHELLLKLVLVSIIAGTVSVLGSSFGTNYSNNIRCIQKERQALLKFKQGLEDEGGSLSSWGSTEDCCTSWKGVRCSNSRGHVVMLDLHPEETCSYEFSFEPQTYILSGRMNTALLELKYMNYLDLSFLYFNNTNFLELITSFSNLRYLNLSYGGLSGTIPNQFGNLSNLISLDLRGNTDLEAKNLDWLSHLPSLRHLAMDGVNLSKAVDWLQVVNMLPSLQHLSLRECGLSIVTPPPTLFNINSSASLSFLDLSDNQITSMIFPSLLRHANSLVFLDLSFNDLRGSFPHHTLEKAISLVHLDLSYNHLERIVPKSLENFQSLQVLNLSSNNLSGEVLIDFAKLPSLKELRLSNNHLNGNLPLSVGKLSKLEVLDVSSNSLDGTITQAHLLNCSLLKELDFSYNSFSLNFSSAWVPTFQLDTLRLSSCRILGSAFPQWLQTQKNLSYLDISNAGISDIIPEWFWDISYKLRYLNLSYNQIKGTVPDLSSRFVGFPGIDLSHNKFSGPLSAFPSNITTLNLSNNSFHGSVSFLCTMSTVTLNYLDLSNNLLFGSLPDCWTALDKLVVLNMANNNLSGTIPNSIGLAQRINTLHLGNNSFVGELPYSLGECKRLEVIDVGENRLTGSIPAWVGETEYLRILVLRSNLFSGSIPPELCHLTSLQVLDLSHNKISGAIPQCLNNITSMAEQHSPFDATIGYSYASTYIYYNADGSAGYYVSEYIDNVLLILKKMGLVYSKNLGLVKAMDLSSNNLTGYIPVELTNLTGLIGLNLSGNWLTGTIPQEISKLKQLDSLDLSRNQLSGGIPSSLSHLTHLGTLDLSDNNLSGRIPTGTQLQGFNKSAFEENPDLCGVPLPKKCPGDEEPDIPEVANTNIEHSWFCYQSAGIGFILSFSGVCGLLLLDVCWNHSYAQYIDELGARIHVRITGG
ncbi:receptor-like protein EIX2 [Ziziphus jujuba]|uniref:Receptor-like protein EIX2 n=1 Tax=Ziziphus jujuba TaxID=326968 RepID=A0ABM4AGK0_ZIZJJ|nr:receptor-like protein EIX2 [Ziziphus jujuba]